MVTIWWFDPKLENNENFEKVLGHILDFYMLKYDNFLLVGDFNSEMINSAVYL